MKRSSLLQHLRRHGCYLKREGRAHSLWCNPQTGAVEAIQRLSRSPHWGWVAMDPVCQLILTVDVGERTLALAHRLGHPVIQVLAPGCPPRFLTDGLRDSLTALVTHDGQGCTPSAVRPKASRPRPRGMPQPGRLYAPVVKSYRRRRMVGVKHRVIFSAVETIASILAKRGWKITTSFVERLTLDFRQHVAAIGRRGNTVCKHEAGRRQQGMLFQVYHNVVLPHARLRVSLSELEAPRDGLHEARAATNAGDGGWAHGSPLESERRS